MSRHADGDVLVHGHVYRRMRVVVCEGTARSHTTLCVRACVWTPYTCLYTRPHTCPHICRYKVGGVSCGLPLWKTEVVAHVYTHVRAHVCPQVIYMSVYRYTYNHSIVPIILLITLSSQSSYTCMQITEANVIQKLKTKHPSNDISHETNRMRGCIRKGIRLTKMTRWCRNFIRFSDF